MNIKDFVRDNHAWLRCEACGAETTILKYWFDPSYGFHRIDWDAMKENLDGFNAKHALCKPPPKPLELFEDNEPTTP